MHSLRRCLWAGLFGSLILAASGCRMFPEALQPHQMWKLNRGASYSEDPFFSVPDRVPELSAVRD